MPSAFAEIASQGPISAVLLAVGSLLFGVVGLLGAYVTLGVVLDLVTPTHSGPTWRPSR